MAVKRDKEYAVFSIIVSGLFIASYTLGAGVLGVPIVVGIAGLIPAAIGMLIVWIGLYGCACYMTKQFILYKKNSYDYITIFKKELGAYGKWIAIVGFIIIYYGFLIGYLAGAANTIKGIFRLDASISGLVVICFIIFAIILIYGTSVVQRGNFVLMLILIICFIYLLYLIYPSVHHGRFLYTDCPFFPCIISFFIFSAVPFLIVPTICRKLHYSKKAVYWSFSIGGVINFLVNYRWIMITIGALLMFGPNENNIIFACRNNLSSSIPLSNISGCNKIFLVVAIFSLVAITTTYLGTGVAAVGFMKDLIYTHNTFIKIKKSKIIVFFCSLFSTIYYNNY